MSKKPKSFKEKFYTDLAPIITGIGASVVIIGALFKIMHWPGAAQFLIAGLGTEALLFLLFAFAPPAHEWDWAKVYPELLDEDEAENEEEEAAVSKEKKKELPEKIGDMLEKAGVNQQLVDKLGRGFSGLADSVNKIGDITSASVATAEYAKNVKSASSSLGEMNKAYGTTITAMSELAGASADAKNYHSQVQSITKNLGALNAVYELELKDANNHLKAMNKFYGNLSSAMENMADASKDTQSFKTELGKLTKNLTSLNNIYGSMLTAMKSVN